MPGPHAVVVVHEQNNKPETGPTHFPAYPLNFTAACMQYQFGAPLGTNSHHASHLQRIKVVTSSTHGTPDLPVYFLSKIKSHT